MPARAVTNDFYRRVATEASFIGPFTGSLILLVSTLPRRGARFGAAPLPFASLEMNVLPTDVEETLCQISPEVWQVGH